MNIIAFRPKTPIEANGWTPEERYRLEALFAAYAQHGEASDWTEARTEAGAPQFFLLGPAPDCECVMSISRISRRYIVEDGRGGAVVEASNLDELFRLAPRLRLSRARTMLIAKLVLGWAVCREFVVEKSELVAGEAIEASEVLTHFIPQIAAFA